MSCFFFLLGFEQTCDYREQRDVARCYITNKLLTSSSDTAKSFNQHWCLKTSAYGGIKFTSRSDVQQERLHNPSAFSSVFTRYVCCCCCCCCCFVAYLSDKSAKWKRREEDWKRVQTIRAGVLLQIMSPGG